MSRLLYVPLVTTTGVDGDGYRDFFSFAERGDHFWYAVVPTWVADDLKASNRIHYVYLDTARYPFVNDLIGFPAFEMLQWFGRRGGKLVVDAAVTNCVGFGVYLRSLLSDRFRDDSVPVVVRDISRFYGREEDRVSRAITLAQCHYAARSRYEIEFAAKGLREILSPSSVRDFFGRSFVWPSMFPPREAKRGKGVTFFIGGDFENSSAKKWAVDVISRVATASGIDAILSTRTAKYKVDRAISDYSIFSSVNLDAESDTVERDEGRSHLFLSVAGRASDADEFEYELSLLARGQIGVFPHSELAEEEISGYPFLYNPGSVEEAESICEWVAQNWDEAVAMAETHVKAVVCKHWTSVAGVASKEIERIIAENYRINRLRDAGTKKAKVPLFHTVHSVAKKLGDRFALSVFLDVLEEHVSWLKPWGHKGALLDVNSMRSSLPTLYDLREMLDNLGWVDECRETEIFVKRIRDPLPAVLK